MIFRTYVPCVGLLVACALAGCENKPAVENPDAGPVGAVLGLKVSDAAARSCEVVLQDPDRAVKRMAYGAGVEGRFLREGPRVAAAFFSKTDAALGNADLKLELGEGGTSANVTVEIGHCFDRAGAALSAAKVEVVR